MLLRTKGSGVRISPGAPKTQWVSASWQSVGLELSFDLVGRVDFAMREESSRLGLKLGRLDMERQCACPVYLLRTQYRHAFQIPRRATRGAHCPSHPT